jgi:hypothetical protein
LISVVSALPWRWHQCKRCLLAHIPGPQPAVHLVVSRKTGETMEGGGNLKQGFSASSGGRGPTRWSAGVPIFECGQTRETWRPHTPQHTTHIGLKGGPGHTPLARLITSSPPSSVSLSIPHPSVFFGTTAFAFQSLFHSAPRCQHSLKPTYLPVLI